MSVSIFSLIIVLGVLIFFHELGHFLVARLLGVGVEKFSLGFGPKLFGKKIGITEYRISAIPLGGYVKMVGESPDSELDPSDIPISFTHKHVFKRILIVAAGPLFNILLALIIFFGIFQISGLLILKPGIGDVNEDTPAYMAGLKKDDLVVSIDGVDISSWEDMANAIMASKGKTLAISVLRGDTILTKNVAPEVKKFKNIFNEDVDRYVIGITASGEVIRKESELFSGLFREFHPDLSNHRPDHKRCRKALSGDCFTKNTGRSDNDRTDGGTAGQRRSGQFNFFHCPDQHQSCHIKFSSHTGFGRRPLTFLFY